MANKPGKVQAILTDIKRIIEEGREWGHSGIIPPRRELAQRYGVTTSTINDVFVLLHAQGYVMQRGRNVVVNPHRFTLPILTPSFDKYLKEQGITPWMEYIDEPAEVKLPEEIAQMFELPAGFKAIRRARIQGEKLEKRAIPYRLTETFYPAELGEKYLTQMRKDPLFVVIDAIKSDTGASIVRSKALLRTRFPSQVEQEQLQITMQTPVNEVFRKSYSDNETLIMFSRIVAPGYRFVLQFDAQTVL